MPSIKSHLKGYFGNFILLFIYLCYLTVIYLFCSQMLHLYLSSKKNVFFRLNNRETVVKDIKHRKKHPVDYLSRRWWCFWCDRICRFFDGSGSLSFNGALGIQFRQHDEEMMTFLALHESRRCCNKIQQ